MARLTLVFHFFVHILLAAVMFLAIGLVAIGLWEFTEWIRSIAAPYVIVSVCEGLTYLLFAVDAICFVFFVLVEGAKLLREIWRARSD
jgi:hypothetical protein